MSDVTGIKTRTDHRHRRTDWTRSLEWQPTGRLTNGKMWTEQKNSTDPDCATITNVAKQNTTYPKRTSWTGGKAADPDLVRISGRKSQIDGLRLGRRLAVVRPQWTRTLWLSEHVGLSDGWQTTCEMIKRHWNLVRDAAENLVLHGHIEKK